MQLRIADNRVVPGNSLGTGSMVHTTPMLTLSSGKNHRDYAKLMPACNEKLNDYFPLKTNDDVSLFTDKCNMARESTFFGEIFTVVAAVLIAASILRLETGVKIVDPILQTWYAAMTATRLALATIGGSIAIMVMLATTTVWFGNKLNKEAWDTRTGESMVFWSFYGVIIAYQACIFFSLLFATKDDNALATSTGTGGGVLFARLL